MVADRLDEAGMSVFLDRLMERISAGESPEDRVRGLIGLVVEELTAQKDDGRPITITGDVAEDFYACREDVVAAVFGKIPAGGFSAEPRDPNDPPAPLPRHREEAPLPERVAADEAAAAAGEAEAESAAHPRSKVKAAAAEAASDEANGLSGEADAAETKAAG